MRPADFVGLKNHLTLFTSPTGLDMWWVTLIFTISTVVISMAIGLLLALVLNGNIPGRTFARTTVFSPDVLSGVGVGMVWNFVFDPQIGLPFTSSPSSGRTRRTGTWTRTSLWS